MKTVRIWHPRGEHGSKKPRWRGQAKAGLCPRPEKGHEI
jgi:hypothetical protein